MNGISFMMANYCARAVGWNMTEGWGQGEKATGEYFRPLETFGRRFEEYLTDAKEMGFEAIDMWTGILDPRWATEEHVETAQTLLRKHNLPVYSLAGWIGSTRDEFVAVCELAGALGTSLLAGGTSLIRTERDFLVDTLNKYGLRLGLENHPETPEEMLAKVGDGGDGTIGATVDTGWFGTQGFDAADAIRLLEPHIFVVHLKDVREAGQHNTCRFGEGVVPIERCVRTLKEIGYSGTISVEHEPESFDPAEDLKASLELLKGWLRQ